MLAAVAVVVVALGCSDLLGSASKDPIASISSLSLPYPTVVIGDVMRDSLGVAAPVKIQAFDVDGNVVSNQSTKFTILDATTTVVATSVQIDSNGFVHGLVRDTLGARVYAGIGPLVAPLQRVIVSVAPSRATQTATPTSITFDPSKLDTLAQSNWSGSLELTITDANAVGAQGFVIAYAVTRSPPPGTAGTPTAYIGDDLGRTSVHDTTDFKGVASRRVILRVTAIDTADTRALLAGKTDTIIVRATVKYNGVDLAGTPFDYVIPVAAKKP